MWNTRYGSEEYAYGTDPNEFFKKFIQEYPPGKLLLPAEGEGRNAVYAAGLGWKVSAFDMSEEGKKKAEQLAKIKQVKIEYDVLNLEQTNYPENSFDAIALIYAHFPPHKKSEYHNFLDRYVKTGGIMILEGFSKSHPEVSIENKKPSGPQMIDMLYSMEEIKEDFNNYEIIALKEKVIELNEGMYHKGKSSVIRFVGRKIK